MQDLLSRFENNTRVYLGPVEASILSRLNLTELAVKSNKLIFTGDHHNGACSGAVYHTPCSQVG